jgi:hypothetical protein
LDLFLVGFALRWAGDFVFFFLACQMQAKRTYEKVSLEGGLLLLWC